MDGWDAEASLAGYFRFYNQERIHQALDYRTPRDVYLDRGSSGGKPHDEKRIEVIALTGIAG
jgi:transposase InsO family protein